jgi:hypothetical protein
LLRHLAAKNAGKGLNTSFNATHDCGKLKQGFLDPAFDLQLEFFHTDRHVMDRCQSADQPEDAKYNEIDGNDITQ